MIFFLIILGVFCGWSMLRVLGNERVQRLHRIELDHRKEMEAAHQAALSRKSSDAVQTVR
jgi:hypothetical protein